MQREICFIALAALLTAGCSSKEPQNMNPIVSRPTSLSVKEIRNVSPALARYTSETIEEELWNRPGLLRRDRSIVTVSALVARCQSAELPNQISLALDHGVRPSEISEIVTHLAFYSG